MHTTSLRAPSRQIQREHDPLVCGLDPDDGSRPPCPACARAYDRRRAADERRRREEDAIVRELGLSRVPRVLDQRERRELILQLLDIERTCRRDSSYRRLIRAVLTRIMEDAA